LTNIETTYIIATLMKKVVISVLSLAFAMALPARVLAEDSQIICPQPYGGGVVCGVHTPVNTGLGDNLVMAGAVLLVSSLIFLVLSKKLNKVSA
jgi:hypothetical protein